VLLLLALGRSSLLIDGDVTIHSLELDGALKLYAPPGAKLIVRRLVVTNRGSVLRELSEAELADDGTPEVSRLRGYVLEDVEVREVSAGAGEERVVDETS
jgi:hypothetical protein